MSKIKMTMLGAAVVALVLPAGAAAHVTLQPAEAPAGGFTRLDVRVPNEQDNAATDKIEVQMPDGFVFVSYQPVPGWTVDLKKQKLAKPVESEDGTIDEQVKTVAFTADDPAAGIQPGQFQDFGLSVGIPESAKEGDELTFPSIQTYDNGDVVRWIGAPDSEEPAPQVLVTAAEDDHHATAGEEESSEDSSSDDDGAPTWLAVVALILGAGGLALGGAAFARARGTG
jgi:uncharacterized protein